MSGTEAQRGPPLVLDGRALAKAEEQRMKARLEGLLAEGMRRPVLATVLVGDDPASATYVRMKGNACQRVGLEPRAVELPASTTTEQLLAALDELNRDPDVGGILLQHPVPEQIDERRCFDAIALAKDVDGVTSLGYGHMAMGMPAWGSCTPMGIMRLLRHHEIPLQGRRALVVGRSPILGKPMAAMLLNANATVTVAHSRTRDLAEEVARAEILVAALGKPAFLKAEWVAPGAVVVDAGYHPDGKCGDIEAAGLAQRCSAYTPVPGGVGPMTINTLLDQTLQAAERSFRG